MRAFLSIMGMYNNNNGIFSDFRVPIGLDAQTAINKILFECAELGLIYTDPTLIPILIKNWTDSNIHNWEKMWEAIDAEYNPIHNYNMEESWEDSSKGVGSGTSDRDVAGFNENSTLVKESRVTDSNKSDVDSTHKGRRKGNIGVTTSQQMIEAEMNIRGKYNMYQIIADSFKRNFCVMIY